MARRLADLPSIPVVSASLLLCAVGLPAVRGDRIRRRTCRRRGVASIVVLGVVCTALAFVVFFALIAEIGPARATVITYVNPAVAVLLGVGLLGEHFTVGHGGRLPADPGRIGAGGAHGRGAEAAVAEPVAAAI